MYHEDEPVVVFVLMEVKLRLVTEYYPKVPFERSQ